jgi:hypothetical protein
MTHKPEEWFRVLVRRAAVALFLLALAIPPAPNIARGQDIGVGVPEDAGLSPLKRRDLPPDGLDTQLVGFGVGGGLYGFHHICEPGSPHQSTNPSVGMRNDCQFGIAEWSMLQFAGFPPGEDIVVRITGPDGSVRTGQVQPESARLGWLSLPGQPLGKYSVTATQAGRTVTGSFSVDVPSRPSIVVVPGSGPPGTTFHVAMAGLQPNTSVKLALLRSGNLGGAGLASDDCFTYTSTLSPLVADAHGQATYDLKTAPDDPAGYMYLLDSEVADVEFGLFPAEELRPVAPPPDGGSPRQLVGQTVGPGPEGDILANASPQAVVQRSVDEWSCFWALAAGSDVPYGPTTMHNLADGRVFESEKAELTAERAKGQYHRARLTEPPLVVSVQVADGRIEAIVEERWQDRLFESDGSLAADLSGTRHTRYVLEPEPTIPGRQARWSRIERLRID